MSLPLPRPKLYSIVQEGLPELDEWEKQLLEEVELMVPEDELLRCLQEERVVFVSDGSAQRIKGSFGWIAARASDRTRLVKCAGPVCTYDHNSYRAEGHGILSVLRFIYRFHKLSDAGDFDGVLLYCDNESMVDRSKKQPAKHDSFPNTTLKSEWDVLAEIWDTLKKMPRGVEITLKHIKGHQDKEKSCAELSLPAQMNVDVDRIAGDYIEANPDKNYSHALMFPSCGALIHLKNGTVTHHMKRALREAAHGEALEDYICKKNDWAPHVIDIIDWEAHRIALNRLRNYRSTLVKHMHNLLPVGKMVNRCDPKCRPNCPSALESICHTILVSGVQGNESSEHMSLSPQHRMGS